MRKWKNQYARLRGKFGFARDASLSRLELTSPKNEATGLKSIGWFRFQARMPACAIESLAAILPRIRRVGDTAVPDSQNRQGIGGISLLLGLLGLPGTARREGAGALLRILLKAAAGPPRLVMN